ncbi:MFS transporter [Deinococcus aestuarii]|uniref:MFS transporter n=1 Tax=Deinococcus aestuarii TaxID=2774531 RepID=UPI001C0AD840|nr:MFS transporter [Deinococcus aestuarii]
MTTMLPGQTPQPPLPPSPEEAILEGARRKRGASVGTLSLFNAVENQEGSMLAVLGPLVRNGFGIGLAEIGVITALGRAARMIFGPLWSMIADRWGRKGVLIITAFWGVFTLAAGFAQNYQQFVLLYGIGLIGTVAAEPISNGILSDLYKDNERGKAFGTLRSVGALLGLVVTPILGQLGNIPNNEGWRYGMYIMGGIGLLTGVLVWLFVKDPRDSLKKAGLRQGKEDQFRFGDVPKILGIPTMALLAVQLLFITSLVLFAFIIFYFTDVRNYSPTEATYLYTVFFAGFGISSFVGGLIGDAFVRRMGDRGRIALMQIYLALFALMSFLATQIDWPSRVVDYGVWFVFGLIGSIGFSGCVLPMVSSVVPPQYRSTSFALLFSFIQGGISTILSLYIGRLAQEYGLRPVLLWLVTVPYAVNAVFWFLFYRTYPRDKARMDALVRATATD